jgi:nitroreductase
MNRRSFLRGAAAAPVVAALTRPAATSAQGLQAITLLRPQKQGGKPLLQALSERKTGRNMGQEKLSQQQLSNLLWAAFGVNRADGRRTVPSAMNVQDIRLYVFLEDGVYLYDAAAHALTPVVAGDHRAKVGGSEAAAKAALGIVYVADYDKYSASGRGGSLDQSQLTAWSNVHAGFIGQNIYLYAASENLAAWFRAFLDSATLTTLLGLRPTQKVLYTQTVGVPPKSA